MNPCIRAAAPRWARLLVTSLLLAGAGQLSAAAGSPADELLARHVALQDQLGLNAFQRPMVLASTDTPTSLEGHIYAELAHPFTTVRPALQAMDHWADILILHLNVKGVRVVDGPAGRTLRVSLGRKNDEPIDRAFPVDFNYRVAVADDTYLQVLLQADTGPLGSKDYAIALEAVPLADGQTFIHLSYSYSFGLSARLALKAYLATLGSDKVGFSPAGQKPDPAAGLIDGVRGVVERNTMRYFLAVEAYLGSLAVPPAERLEQRLHAWFAATEGFRRQLHEVEEADYLAMKRKEVRRQQAGAGPGGGG